MTEVQEPGGDENSVKNDFNRLCRELNMDRQTEKTAWNYYCETKHKYTLEVRNIDCVSLTRSMTLGIRRTKSETVLL